MTIYNIDKLKKFVPEVSKHCSMALVAIGLLATPASALTMYDESISGDLDAIGSTVVPLGLGSNDIFGSILQTPTGDTDRINFFQVPGLVIDSIFLSFTAPFDGDNVGQSLTTALFNNVANLFDDNFNSITSGAVISAIFFDSFGAETGPLSQDTGGATWDFQLSSGVVFPNQPWKLTINTSEAPSVSEVPVPAALPLFGTGIALLGFMNWRRKRKAA